MEVRKRICDRCGCEIKYHGWTALIKGFRKFFIRKLYNGNPDGYSYNDWDVELCSDCTKELERFIKSGVYHD